MNIFVFGTRGFPDIQGGVEMHCEKLYPLLAEKDIKITVFRRKPYVVNKEIVHKNIKFIDLASTKIGGFEAFFHSFLSVIHCITKKPDIIHIHNIGPGLFIPILKLFNKKVVLTYHSPNYEHKKWNFFGKNILKFGEFVTIKFADKIIFVSDSQKNKVGQNSDKCVHIPNGIIENIKILKDSSYLEKFNLEKENYILFVGRFVQEKGIDILVRAFKKITGNIKLVLAGTFDHKTNYYLDLEKLIKTDDRIVCTGYVRGDDLTTLYQNTKLFVLPSFNEGFPIALLEAMSYNLDVLVSDIPANKEVALASESYFKVGNVDDLIIKINSKLQKTSQVQYDLSKYRWQNIADQTNIIYTNLVKKK